MSTPTSTVRLRAEDIEAVAGLADTLEAEFPAALHLVIQEGVASLREHRAERLERMFALEGRVELLEGIAARVLPGLELSKGEACIIMDVLNGTILLGAGRGVAPETLYAEVSDGISLNHLDKKWEVDGKKLLARIRTWGPAEAASIADAAARFWVQCERPAGELLVELRLVPPSAVEVEACGECGRGAPGGCYSDLPGGLRGRPCPCKCHGS